MMKLRLFLLRFGSDRMRLRIVKALGRSNDFRAQEALIKVLNDDSYRVKKEAAQALGAMGDAQVVGPLILLIEESFHYAMARTAVNALERVLNRVAAVAIPEDLLAAATLDDVNGIYYESREGIAWFSKTRTGTHWTMDCSKVRTLAHREVLRRGLAV